MTITASAPSAARDRPRVRTSAGIQSATQIIQPMKMAMVGSPAGRQIGRGLLSAPAAR